MAAPGRQTTRITELFRAVRDASATGQSTVRLAADAAFGATNFAVRVARRDEARPKGERSLAARSGLDRNKHSAARIWTASNRNGMGGTAPSGGPYPGWPSIFSRACTKEASRETLRRVTEALVQQKAEDTISRVGMPRP